MSKHAAQLPDLLRQAMTCHQSGQIAAAEALYQQILQYQPRHFDALHLYGVLAKQTGRAEMAFTLLNKAVGVNPRNAEACCNLAEALCALQRPAEATQFFRQALKLDGKNVNSYLRHAGALLQQQDFSAALACLAQAAALPNLPAWFYFQQGFALQNLQQHQQAADSFNKAIELQNNFAEAYYNLGMSLMALKQPHTALPCFDKALALMPGSADAALGRGNALSDLRRFDEALSAFELALALQPNLTAVYFNLGNTLCFLKRFTDAIDAYQRLYAVTPDYPYLPGQLIRAKQMICDWRDLPQLLTDMATGINADKPVCDPLFALNCDIDPALQVKAAHIYAKEKFNVPPSAPDKYTAHQRIRIGYFSGDFRMHPVAYLTAGMFEHHDRSRFEIYAFAFGPNQQCAMRQRLETAFEHFIDISHLSDQEAAELAGNLELDIAVDLGGYTEFSRTGIFAHRAAPLQVSYLGYPGSMAAGFMDFLIADPTIMPPEQRRHYFENIAYLPGSYMVCDNSRPIADSAFSREAMDLPAGGLVFCCFNNVYKINPAMFAVWMQILRRVPDSVLWLSVAAQARDNLRWEAEAAGVAASRLVFSKPVLDNAEHLARQRLADLFLDTLPYNAHTTATEALWAGVPVLTCAGATMAGRTAASLLTALELPELITANLPEYEELAVTLALNAPRLAALRAKLAEKRLTAPLFDTALFTRRIESAYAQMYRRLQADLPPEDIWVD